MSVPEFSDGSVPKEEQAGNAPVVKIERVSKRFRSVAALRGVSLIIPQGEIFGLLGPNGAGKSTLIKLLLGFLEPDDGKIMLFGSPNLARAHARIGYLPERPTYHGNFTGREYLRFHAELTGYRSREARLAADHALEAVGLKEAGGRRIRTYSKGMRQRLGLAVALLSGGNKPPDLLILDEPASGLAPEGQVAVRELILQCRERGSTVLLCSHQLTEVEHICSAVGVLRAGRLVLNTRLDESPRVLITGVSREGAPEIAAHLIAYLKGLHPQVAVNGGVNEGEPLRVSLPTGPNVPQAAPIKAAALRAMIDGRWDITSVYVESKDLESLYLAAVQSPKNGRTNEPDKQDVIELVEELQTLQTLPHITTPLGPLTNGVEGGVEGDGEGRTTAGLGGKPTTPLLPIQPRTRRELPSGDATGNIEYGPISEEAAREEA